MLLYLFRNTSVSRRDERRGLSRGQTGHSQQEHASVSHIPGVSEMIEMKERQKEIRLYRVNISAITEVGETEGALSSVEHRG